MQISEDVETKKEEAGKIVSFFPQKDCLDYVLLCGQNESQSEPSSHFLKQITFPQIKQLEKLSVVN